MGRFGHFVALVAAAAQFGCREPSPLVEAPPPPHHEDIFTQRSAALIDFLWVIDNSESMKPVQDNLVTNLSGFMTLLASRQVDYRIAVITTDIFNASVGKGKFIGSPPVITPKDTDPTGLFKRNIQEVGIKGKGHEEAFEAARLAIERERASAVGVLSERAACLDACPAAGDAAAQCREACARDHSPSFMRPDAHLYLVFVSDEEEQSAPEVRWFARNFEQALGVGNEGAVSASTICGDVPTSPCWAQAGMRFHALAEATGGLTGSICDASFQESLVALANDSVGLKRKFWLSKSPKLETLKITVQYRCDSKPDCASDPAEDALCETKSLDHPGYSCAVPNSPEDGWTYEPSTNAILFAAPVVPTHRTRIVASYQPLDES